MVTPSVNSYKKILLIDIYIRGNVAGYRNNYRKNKKRFE